MPEDRLLRGVRGISFAPGSEVLFIAVLDCTVSSLMEYNPNDSDDEST